MASALYPDWKEACMNGTANADLDGAEGATGVWCALVDTGTYTYASTDNFYDDLSGIAGTDQEILSKTVGTVGDAIFDGTDLTYTAVAAGASLEALVIYRKNAGANTTWYLVAFIDSGDVTGLPVTPNGGDITVAWAAGGIFTLSDRRLKENIREIGNVGDLPIYDYNYVGQEQRHCGLIAQDVEKVVPEAVIDFGKFKAVNYEHAANQALELAA